jgi:osmotically inducible lipoprotein OsmB
MRIRKILMLSALVVSVGATAADANCQGRKTTDTLLGAGAGGVVGDVITHGSPIGVIGGAVVGGYAGHSIASDNCRHDAHYTYRNGRKGYYDHDGRWHYV